MPDYGDMRTAIRAFNEHVRTLEDVPVPSGCCLAPRRNLDGELRCTECTTQRLG